MEHRRRRLIERSSARPTPFEHASTVECLLGVLARRQGLEQSAMCSRSPSSEPGPCCSSRQCFAARSDARATAPELLGATLRSTPKRDRVSRSPSPTRTRPGRLPAGQAPSSGGRRAATTARTARRRLTISRSPGTSVRHAAWRRQRRHRSAPRRPSVSTRQRRHLRHLGPGWRRARSGTPAAGARYTGPYAIVAEDRRACTKATSTAPRRLRGCSQGTVHVAHWTSSSRRASSLRAHVQRPLLRLRRRPPSAFVRRAAAASGSFFKVSQRRRRSPTCCPPRSRRAATCSTSRRPTRPATARRWRGAVEDRLLCPLAGSERRGRVRPAGRRTTLVGAARVRPRLARAAAGAVAGALLTRLAGCGLGAGPAPSAVQLLGHARLRRAVVRSSARRACAGRRP